MFSDPVPASCCSVRVLPSEEDAQNLFLRHQLSIALRRAPSRLRLRGGDRALLVWMTPLWPGLLGVAHPLAETVDRVGFPVLGIDDCEMLPLGCTKNLP